VTFTLKRETPNWDATRRLVMIHVAMKFRQIIFSGSEVTVRTNEKCDVRTYRRTDVHTDVQTGVTEPNTIAPPFGAGAKNNLVDMHLNNNTKQVNGNVQHCI
jgi:hypothetical protein